jgi:hypothetical protein
MRTPVENEHDREELEALNPEPWMVELLDLNPGYVFWGPHEDYMCAGNYEHAWDNPVLIDGWKEFGWQLDELNECVNFYFDIGREREKCDACDESGQNPETKKIADDFYDFANTGSRWCDKITQDEADALVEGNRGRAWDSEEKCWKKVPRTAEEFNLANRRGGPGYLKHDAINRWILVETRAKRLGVYGHCSECDGRGYNWTADAAHVTLVLWWLHPRKGCSRALEVKSILKDDLPGIFSFLQNAATRNADRFSSIMRFA